MKPPTEFLQGLGIGAGLIAVMAAVTLLIRPGLTVTAQTSAAPAGRPVIEPRRVGETTALLPPDYLDLCRRAGL